MLGLAVFWGRRRLALAVIPLVALTATGCASLQAGASSPSPGVAAPDRLSTWPAGAGPGGTGRAGAGPADKPTADAATAELAARPVRGRAPKTGYSRAAFGPAWADTDANGCDTRDDVLARDLVGVTVRPGTHGCVVLTGRLSDPYTGQTIVFSKSDAAAVQIDHVVALADAWQTGASTWSPARRRTFANDPLNLLAVDGPTNEAKGDGDAATWLPPDRAFRCRYVAIQVEVKTRYGLWTTSAEHAAMVRVLADCPAG